MGGEPKRKDLVLIFGASGYGKTELGLRIYGTRYTKGGQCLFIDPTGNYGHLGRRVRSARELEQLAEAAGDRPFSLVYQPDGDDLSAMWQAIYRRGRLLVLVDEAQNFGRAGEVQPGLHRLISQGRHRLVSLVMIVRTPPEMPKVARGNYESLYTFRQTEPDYARWLATRYFDVPDAERRIQRLERFHFLRVDAAGKITRGKLS
ncbi:MAG TPA: AAA family ATPase [Longimicrobiaceae bacterium]|nr:AAA family ATPase [Longimicrobiaceae bacterium]